MQKEEAQKVVERKKPAPIWNDYGIYLEDGFVVAVRCVDDGKGRCLCRDAKEGFDELFKKAVRWLACHHPNKFSEILRGMQEDEKYYQMAKDEIYKFIDELKSLMG